MDISLGWEGDTIQPVNARNVSGDRGGGFSWCGLLIGAEGDTARVDGRARV